MVNNEETSRSQPRYVKNNNFIMPKCPFKSCNENPELLKRTIFASELDDKTSVSCSTARDSSIEKTLEKKSLGTDLKKMHLIISAKAAVNLIQNQKSVV